jgi:hypothetical protein
MAAKKRINKRTLVPIPHTGRSLRRTNPLETGQFNYSRQNNATAFTVRIPVDIARGNVFLGLVDP